ncbi:SDR family NAD(P)-dependent oxidoreductase [Compostimonas suwonensis]|uniref:NAD(P)-dependent dehydrogenase (Short-subunit alcohol dehydrogenase family) n=1 Tax=Compostimonas suwonensis TaxID=1048394 RepID=A0A2M9BU98_9MICO|nr:SDR family NAD(P)-dependent oxidoreductase [Compostimonas suwonensis]PJJ61501.1 NAD(P)-dependent dehydrogenase (short-subunit alcohol dehydrogenase family) [Compostimonas suwonensis]
MSASECLVDLRGRRALVTGGGSGIGRASAILLADAGARVTAVDVSGDGLEQTVGAADGLRGSVEALVLDVSEWGAVQTALGSLEADIVINAAGIMIRKDLEQTQREDWERIVSVNLSGCFAVLKATVPRMRRGGSIIQIASMTANSGNRYPAYTATKGGMLSMTRELAAELGPRGIRVNSISPGVIVTGINRDHYTREGSGATAIAMTPLERLGEAEDVARCVLFLASDMSGFITGADIRVDGGLTATRVI